MLLRNEMIMECMDWILWKLGTRYYETIRGVELWGYRCKGMWREGGEG